MISRGPRGAAGDALALGGGDDGLIDGEMVDDGVGVGEGVARAAGPIGADVAGWLPIQIPIPNPTTAVAPRMAARTGPWPILATVAWADTSSYLDLKYASCTGVPLMLATIVVEPSTVLTTTW